MAEGIRKSDGIIDLQQQVRDPDSWQPLVQIKNKLISLRRDGGTYDNALAETINGLYKTEVIRRRSSWGLMPEGAESYAKPFSATCIRQ